MLQDWVIPDAALPGVCGLKYNGAMSIRFYAGLWLGKLAILASRWLGWGGSTLPGRLARRLDPGILSRLARQSQAGNLMVSGTNGKTTTSKMISEVVSAGGYKLTYNRAGANLIFGLTAAYLDSAGWLGRVDSDLGLLEVDEASLPRAAAEADPIGIVVTNFFRDQLDRYGELEHTVGFVRDGLRAMRAGTTAVLNADDPLVAGLGRDPGIAGRLATLYYGIEDESAGSPEMSGGPSDAKHCSGCGQPYRYSTYYYAHLGKYRCPGCGQERPVPEVVLVAHEPLGARGARLIISTPKGEIRATIAIPGLYNIYNALAAAAAGLALDFSPAQIAQGLQSFNSSFGRMELIPIGDQEVFLALVKNPVGYDEVIRTVINTPEPKNLLLALNDKYADGTDISWIWDVDFEMLAQGQERFDQITCSGIRAEDLAVRLKYAGINLDRIEVENDLKRALLGSLERLGPGQMLYVMPTYTAMIELRDIIAKMGYARQFWEV